ncbi:MAG: CHASE domain-containing protein [Microcoleus sp. PH2017_10_PVI_O_A]|uniref:CHASE domain-containing protein n=1 Tax=unclassified Microcoleus TaxID=2642155 RepID=UPI001D241D90|nr:MULTISPECIES: CHASE domain-containing protein [unclassified Microcoleus]TAE77726.1 MAG: histidine kinase [Oscillatoriales cyanobacterium]MCC3408986.1 CHASE domain-containing protein [Microcoleus sp. PH2017_10_PVI_O_A]MCC3463121.1 CHASE domain-containing protein [Microcoleus sp. PH2017_11_PCY_U_A]MCC3481536.1 CHASE domain-containing protein [Microcoleus sp. PH2017_12_PCY_D_A]MCC3531517.1 CHASE domain-containing protein [Microcoleus sp. PH2017_21_RUC_O_A]
MNVASNWFNSVTKNLQSYRPYLPAALTLCTGTGLSLIAAAVVWHWENQRMEAEFHQQADRLNAALQQSINKNLDFLYSIQAFYSASTEVSRQDFKQFVQPALARNSAIRSVNWVLRVPAADKAAYEEAIRAEGFPAFQIYERDADKKPVPVKVRSEYFPVTYREALEADIKALGFDLASNPDRKAALEKSVNTRKIAASGKIKLVSNDRLGLQLFLPVAGRTSSPDNSANSRENIRGVISGVFQITNMVNFYLESLNLDHINFYLYDNSATAKERFLVRYDSQTKQLIDNPQLEQPELTNLREPICENHSACTRTFNVADRQWMLLVLPAKGYNGLSAHEGSLAIGAIGLLMTGSLTIYLLMSLERTAKVEQQVRDRTIQLKERTAELETALKNLQQAQFKLIQTEKMSSLGQLVAGVAHEINNPVCFISGNLSHAGEYTQNLLELVEIYQQQYPNPTPEVQAKLKDIDLDFISEDLPKILKSMNAGADRIRQIVLFLRNFSRLDEAEMKSVNIHEGIDSTLMILESRLKANGDFPGIKIIKEYGSLPLVECWAGQLNQVFMNVLSNAIDVFSDENKKDLTRKYPSDSGFLPAIRIRTELLSYNCVCVRIADNGAGMTENVKKHLFEPFFTTKPVGKGTGLGLSIGYQIVEKHQGSLRCVSAPGEGTEFWIEVPVRQQPEPSVANISSAVNVSRF